MLRKTNLGCRGERCKVREQAVEGEYGEYPPRSPSGPIYLP